jgi:esterase/lipase
MRLDETQAAFQKQCKSLDDTRQRSIATIEEIEELINSITNTPNTFESPIMLIKAERMKFRETESYAVETYQKATKPIVGTVADIGIGTATVGVAGVAGARLTQAAVMWGVKTFGRASTGTAISRLSGAAANNAVLALLGGGTLRAGGRGIAGGTTFLSKTINIGGLVIAGVTAVCLITLYNIDKQVPLANILLAREALSETVTLITRIHNETATLLDKVIEQLRQAKLLSGNSYSSMSIDEQLLLDDLVNNTLFMAEMLNKTVE